MAAINAAAESVAAAPPTGIGSDTIDDECFCLTMILGSLEESTLSVPFWVLKTPLVSLSLPNNFYTEFTVEKLLKLDCWFIYPCVYYG